MILFETQSDQGRGKRERNVSKPLITSQIAATSHAEIGTRNPIKASHMVYRCISTCAILSYFLSHISRELYKKQSS